MKGEGSIEILYHQERTLESGTDIIVGLLSDPDLQYAPDNWETEISEVASFIGVDDSVYLFPDFSLEPFLPAPPNPTRRSCDICGFITTTYSEIPIFARLISRYKKESPALQYESKYTHRDMKSGSMRFCERCINNINDVVEDEFENGNIQTEIVADKL